MLDLKQLSSKLTDSREELVISEHEDSSILKEYQNKLHLVNSLKSSDNLKLPPYSGSKILEEGPLVRHFSRKFSTRSEATDWAMGVLKGKTIAAVDGSQVYASRAYSVPIGLAQSGLVVNRHTGIDGFSKSYLMALIFPRDFDEYGGASAYSTLPVSLRRHELEYEAVIDLMQKEPGNIIFLDGSLVLSFINQLDEAVRTKYAESVIRLMKASEETRTPVVAYTDMSLNKDLVTMMRHCYGLPYTTHLSDSRVLVGGMRWGDRTRAFISDRDDRDLKEGKSVLDRYGPYRDTIAFFYLQSGGDLPSKIELPRWAYEAGMVDDIANVIRAQCIIRPGYPDIIHRAHEYTAISQSEAEQFNKMLERFAEASQIRVYKSAKEFNKRI
jgi:hypothetical protein